MSGEGHGFKVSPLVRMGGSDCKESFKVKSETSSRSLLVLQWSPLKEEPSTTKVQMLGCLFCVPVALCHSPKFLFLWHFPRVPWL